MFWNFMQIIAIPIQEDFNPVEGLSYKYVDFENSSLHWIPISYPATCITEQENPVDLLPLPADQ